MPDWINLANLFTLCRLILVPFIIQAHLAGHRVFAIVLFAVAAFTDFLDGASARRLAIVTPVGAYFDPIADKCLLSGVFLALAFSAEVPWWLVAVIFGRDVFILGAAGLFLWLTPIRKFPPTIWGKVSTFVQIVTAILCMFRAVLDFSLVNWLSSASIWFCAAFTIWSGLHYTWRGIALARSR